MRKLEKLILLLLLFALALVLPCAVFAAEDGLSVKIPFTISGAPATVVMESRNGAPAPEQAEFSGTTEGAFTLHFSEVGDYRYKIYQRIPSGSDSVNMTYDDRVYDVFVSVVYGADDELSAVVVVSLEGNANKPDSVAFENTPAHALLTIDMVAVKDGVPIETVSGGMLFSYEITLKNVGGGTATDVLLDNILPVEIPLLTVDTIYDGGQLSMDGLSILWNLGNIAPGESVTVSFSVLVPSVWADTQWIDTAKATYYGGYMEGGNDGNASADTTTTATAVASVLVNAPAPELLVEKEQSLNGGARTKARITVKPGDIITYYVTLTNNSEATAENVTLTDAIPNPPWLLLNESTISHGGKADNNIITWDLGSLDAGESVTVIFDVTVPEASQYTLWVNQATGSYTRGTETLARAVPEVIPLLSNPVEAEYRTETSPPPDNSSEKPTNPGDNRPGTGDDGNLGIWMMLMIGSIAGLALCLLLGKRKPFGRNDKR